MSTTACVDYKYAAILAVAFGPVKIQAIWPAAIDGGTLGPPSDDLDASKHFFKEVSQLNYYFFGTFLPSSTWP